MKYPRRIILIAAVCMLLLVAMTAPASAQTGYENIVLRVIGANATGCSIGQPTTSFFFNIMYDSPVDLDYTITMLAVPAGASGSGSGSLPAGTVANTTIGFSLNTIVTAPPWSLTIQLDGFVGGTQVTTATARIDCPQTAGPYSATPLSFANVYLVPGVAGCDSYVPLTASSVVGTFTQTTPVYWQPSADSASNVVIEAGKSYWVLGVDASGGYYRVVIGCSLVWAPVATVGPNYDDVWGGRPLPTNVVS